MRRPDGGAAVAAFHQLTQRQPYKWQERLLCRWFLEGRLPDAVDIPTGLGKTAAIALWLVALAVGIKLPLRLIYVVDRRTVVDQASEEADGLAYALGEADGDDPAINELRRGLRLEKRHRLAVSTLRGQYLDNRLWLEDPAAPAIIVGTVDMIGSRLLFEGYGVSPRMRPVHAGLIGADALVMLDEAHLVPPFAALLRSIAETWAPAPVPRFHLLTLSATGREQGYETGKGLNSFGLEPEDWDDAPVQARLEAAKRLQLWDLPADADLVESLAQRAFERGDGGKRVLVFCNSRTVAQKVCEWLIKKGVPAEPLVGARRVHEREELKNSLVFRRFDPNAPPPEGEPAQPAFLVATSAGEVGVDLDADHMVCDLVPWERMVQRLGRVNRRASPGEALVDVFCRIPVEDAEDTADVARLARWRAPFDSAAWPIGSDGRRDASPGMLHRLKDVPTIQPILKAAASEEPLRPALTRALVDTWSMTSLPVHPGRPDAEPWLRGWVKDEPQTRVVWRRLLPGRPDDDDKKNRKKTLSDFFQYAPPHISEILETLTSDVVDTLQKRAKTLASPKHQDKLDYAIPAVGAVILSRRGEVDEVLPLHDLSQPAKQLFGTLAGRTIVIDARLGGLDAAGLLDATIDTAPNTLDGEGPQAWGAEFLQAPGYRVRAVPANDQPDREWPVEWRWRMVANDDTEDGEEIRVEIWRRSGATRGDPAIARIAQRLAQHHDWTASEADAIARRLTLPEEYRTMLVAAAAVHDAGKARELWQRAMRAPRDEGRPYAKTAGGGIPGLLEIAGQTYRHEFGSLRDAENDPMIRSLPEELRDLALHLIAAHHGYARPVIAAVDPDNAPSASAALAREAALRFARLQARWGSWGLAWWEALLRAADWAASRKLNEDAEDL